MEKEKGLPQTPGSSHQELADDLPCWLFMCLAPFWAQAEAGAYSSWHAQLGKGQGPGEEQ